MDLEVSHCVENTSMSDRLSNARAKNQRSMRQVDPSTCSKGHGIAPIIGTYDLTSTTGHLESLDHNSVDPRSL